MLLGYHYRPHYVDTCHGAFPPNIGLIMIYDFVADSMFIPVLVAG